MTNETQNARASITISPLAGLFWVVVFMSCAATGNCSACGFSRDYAGEYLDRCTP